jgi:hypothetical protein
LVNADRIERIERGDRQGGPDERYRARLSDGTLVSLDISAADIERALAPVVVAAPGFSHLRYYSDYPDSSGRGSAGTKPNVREAQGRGLVMTDVEHPAHHGRQARRGRASMKLLIADDEEGSFG